MSSEQKALVALQKEIDETETYDFDEMESVLEQEITDSFADLEFLEQDRKKVGDPESLSHAVENIVWEQFCNQVGINAGETVYGQYTQTTENFAKGKLATHNRYVDYQKRYDDWQLNFRKDPNAKVNPNKNERYNDEKKVWEKQDNRTGEWKTELNTDARSDFDRGRPSGNQEKNKQMDHTIPAAEIIRDPEANAHLGRQEQVDFANSEKNLNLIDANVNQSKSDSTMEEFLNSKRNGKTPSERFNIDEESLRNKDKGARKEYAKVKNEGEQRSVETGRESMKADAARVVKEVAGEGLKAIILALLADLLRTIIGKLVIWFKASKRKLKELIEHIKDAVREFFVNIKERIKTAADIGVTTILASVFGPIVRTLKKAWMLIKRAGKTIKAAFNYFKNPENYNKPFSVKIMEVGKIIIAGLAAGGSLLLGDVIEKFLITVPPFGFEIPLLGSIGSIVGIFLGGVVCGLLGAIAISFIEKRITQRERHQVVVKELIKQQDIIERQEILKHVAVEITKRKIKKVENDIMDRHNEAKNVMKDSISNILRNESVIEENEDKVVRDSNEIKKVHDAIDRKVADIDELLKKLE